MYDIFGTLLNEYPTAHDTHKPSVSFQAKRYMELHYYDDIQISDIANTICVNANYLSTIFRKEIGITPKIYLTNLKIHKAKKILCETDDPISLVANSVGFSNALSFSKFFKKEVGTSPSEFRKVNKSHG